MRHCKIAPLHQLGICHNNVTVDNTFPTCMMYVTLSAGRGASPRGGLAPPACGPRELSRSSGVSARLSLRNELELELGDLEQLRHAAATTGNVCESCKCHNVN